MSSLQKVQSLNDAHAYSKLEAILRKAPIWIWVAALSVLAVFRNGIGLVGIPTPDLETFPTPQPQLHALAYGLRTIAFALHIEGGNAYIPITVVMAFVFLSTVLLGLRGLKTSNVKKIFLLVILTSPISLTICNQLGANDVVTLLGAFILGRWGRSIPIAMLGGVIMSLGNPAQALSACLVVLILSYAQELQDRRIASWVVFIQVGVTFGILHEWGAANAVDSQAAGVQNLLMPSLYAYLGNLPLSIYAGLGIFWVVIGFCLYQRSRRTQISIIISLLIIPTLATITTLDQTRVFVGVSTAGIVAVLVVFLPQILERVESFGIKSILSWAIGLALLCPAIYIDFNAKPVMPYQWLLYEMLPMLKANIVG